MKIPVYLQLEPRYVGNTVRDAKVVAATNTAPNQRGGTALVLVELDIPASAFGPIATARVEIPESSVVVKVEADVPTS